MKKLRKYGIWLLVAVMLCWNIFLTWKVYGIKGASNTTVNTTVNQEVSQITNTFTDVVQKTQDKVVIVYNYQNNQLYASGSGNVYQANGRDLIIVTNHHVIDGETSVRVKFTNGEEFAAQVVGSDPYSDLAVLKVTVDFDIEPFSLGDSSLVSVGEQVLAIGTPLGDDYAGTVTSGIISGKDRTISMDIDGNGTDDWDMLVLQTDAAINPGNSGGALVNMAGELIGIPSSKISSSSGESVEGMGFAIPINEVITIVSQLMTDGKVTRPAIGISAVALTDLTSSQRRYYNVSETQQGLYISSIVAGGAAEAAGIKEGDIITSFDGQDVVTFKEFRKTLYSKNVGDVVEVKVLRGSQTLTFQVKLS